MTTTTAESAIPDDFHTADWVGTSLHTDTTLWRFTGSNYAHLPLYFGYTGDYRFDAPPHTHPDGSTTRDFGVCYLAEAIAGAFVETFCRVPRPPGPVLLSAGDLSGRSLLECRIEHPLELFDLTGSNFVRMGRDMEVSVSRDYSLSQFLSGAIHTHHQQFDGILYLSRHEPSRRCVALFDRASYKVEITTHTLLETLILQGRLDDVLDVYQVALPDLTVP